MSTKPKPARRKPAAQRVSGGARAGSAARPAAQIVGALDRVVGTTVEGWAMNSGDPDRPVTVELYGDDRLLGSATAFMFRPDLLEAGIGTGNHSFLFELPDALLDGAVHTLAARAAGSPERIGDALSFQAPATGRDLADGMLELVSEEGWVRGWVWYPAIPDRRVEVEVLVDGEVVGETIAVLHRNDLVAAGIGDGNYSFALALPYEILSRPSASLVSVRDKADGRVFAEPRLFQRRAIEDAIGKLNELEDDARLLQSTMGLVADRVAADERAAVDLFRTVGDFFVQLANATAAGRSPASLKTLRGAIEDITTSYPRLELGAPANPQLTICVEAAGQLGHVYDTLDALSRLDAVAATEVILLDNGACDEAALLPLVVRNLRYLHAGDGLSLSSALNQCAAAGRGEILVFLRGSVMPSGDWLLPVHAAFRDDPGLALLAAKVIGADGLVDSAGTTLANGRPAAVGAGSAPSAAIFSHGHTVDGVAAEAFAVRRDMWLRSRGLDERQPDIGSALAVFCARAAGGGGRIAFLPEFVVEARHQAGDRAGLNHNHS